MATDVTEPVFTAWPVVAATITVTGGFVVVILTHFFTRRRELQMLEVKRKRDKEDAEEKRLKEFRFISVELIFRLEEFAQKCALVSNDNGLYSLNPYAERPPVFSAPEPVRLDVDGEWKSIPSDLHYQLLELPVRGRAIQPVLDEVLDQNIPPHQNPWYAERQRQYADLGLRALMLARRLRRLGCYPETRLADGPRSPHQIMWDVHRRRLPNRKT